MIRADARFLLIYQDNVISGDTTLFMRADQVKVFWSVLMPILNVWKKSKPVGFPN
jgi:glucose-6-phosphate 1-dehydrogenase